MTFRIWFLSLLTACGANVPQPQPEPAAAPVPQAAAADDAKAMSVTDPGPTALIDVPAGNYAPLFPGRDGKKQIPVAAFRIERFPVSNAQFLAFVAAEPKWRKSRVASLFADESYLASWSGDLEPGADALDRPVTGVSWFAARAYARWRHLRLPTLAEWERVAAVPLADGSNPSKAALTWYARPAGGGPARIGTGAKNALGVADLYGLVWEWVSDFASAMVTGDARGDTDLQRSLFCGAGAVGSARPDDYAAFMRQALRSSLQGRSTTTTLGFRCATDATPADTPPEKE